MNRHLIAAAISQHDAFKVAAAARYWLVQGDHEMALERQLIAAAWYARSRKWYQNGLEEGDE
jgi:hypothetical protein